MPAFDTATDAGAVLGRAVVGPEEEKEGVEEDGEEVVAGFTLSPRGRASTPVGRFCNRQED